MTKMKCTVVDIFGLPFYQHNMWCLNVKYTCFGITQKTILTFALRKEANNIKVNYTFYN